MNAINVDIVRSLFMPLFLGGTLAAAALAKDGRLQRITGFFHPAKEDLPG